MAICILNASSIYVSLFSISWSRSENFSTIFPLNGSYSFKMFILSSFQSVDSYVGSLLFVWHVYVHSICICMYVHVQMFMNKYIYSCVCQPEVNSCFTYSLFVLYTERVSFNEIQSSSIQVAFFSFYLFV